MLRRRAGQKLRRSLPMGVKAAKLKSLMKAFKAAEIPHSLDTAIEAVETIKGPDSEVVSPFKKKKKKKKKRGRTSMPVEAPTCWRIHHNVDRTLTGS